jgi:hypothetical protein
VKLERWDQVRDLCSEEEWANIKQDLVVYVLKQENTNVKSKIELLMKDGLYAQCISIFPSPSGEAGEMELLEQLWKELERNQPAALDQLLAVVSRYMKRYYQVRTTHPFSFAFFFFPSTISFVDFGLMY